MSTMLFDGMCFVNGPGMDTYKEDRGVTISLIKYNGLYNKRMYNSKCVMHYAHVN